MTIDVNVLNIVIAVVVLRFVYVVSFRVAKHKYVTGKKAIAKTIHEQNELSRLYHVINGLFPEGYMHGGLLSTIIQKNIHTLQDMEQVANLLKDPSYNVSEKNKEIFDFAAGTYCNTLQIISVLSQITVESEPLHQNVNFINGMYHALEKGCVFNHEIMLNAAGKYAPETSVWFIKSISRSEEGAKLLKRRGKDTSFRQLLNGSLPPYRDVGLGRFFFVSERQ